MSDVGADLSTVETLTVEGYEVRVSRTADGAAWQALVTDADAGSATISEPSGMLGMMATINTNSDDDTDDAVPEGPTVTAPHRWVAIGFAIEAYEFADVGEEAVDVAEGYASMTIDGEEFEITSGDLSLSDGMTPWQGMDDDGFRLDGGSDDE